MSTSFGVRCRWAASDPRTDSKKHVHHKRLDLAVRSHSWLSKVSFSCSRKLPQSDSRACRERVEGLVGSDPVSRDRSSLADERKRSLAEERNTRYLAEHLERKFGASGSSSKSDGRSGRVTSATAGTDSANAHDVQDKTSASSKSMVPPKSGEPGTDECPANK